MDDPDVKRVYKIAKKYRENVVKYGRESDQER